MIVIAHTPAGEKLYRTVTRTNLIKVTKSIILHFPGRSYSILHATIFNAMQKGEDKLELR